MTHGNKKGCIPEKPSLYLCLRVTQRGGLAFCSVILGCTRESVVSRCFFIFASNIRRNKDIQPQTGHLLSAPSQMVDLFVCSLKASSSQELRGSLSIGFVSFCLDFTTLFQAYCFSRLQFTLDIFISRSNFAVSIKSISWERSLSDTVVEKFIQSWKRTKGLADKQGPLLTPKVNSGNLVAWQQEHF